MKFLKNPRQINYKSVHYAQGDQMFRCVIVSKNRISPSSKQIKGGLCLPSNVVADRRNSGPHLATRINKSENSVRLARQNSPADCKLLLQTRPWFHPPNNTHKGKLGRSASEAVLAASNTRHRARWSSRWAKDKATWFQIMRLHSPLIATPSSCRGKKNVCEITESRNRAAAA
jgi:hypothetical protein